MKDITDILRVYAAGKFVGECFDLLASETKEH